MSFRFPLGLTEDDGLRDSLSESSVELLQRGKVEGGKSAYP